MFKNIILIALLVQTLLSQENLQKVTLQLKWIDQFQFAGYYTAIEKGFYKDEGLDVKLIAYNPKDSVVEKVLNNEIDFALESASIMVHAASGKEILLLASIFQSSPLALLALGESNINTFEDFKGKKILFTNDQQFYLTLQAMLKSHNITLSDIEILESKNYDIENLITKKADIMVAYTTNEPYVLKEKGYESKLFYPKDYGFDFYEEILFTSKEKFKNNPELVDRFYRASIKGWLYAYENIEEIAKIVHKKYNTMNKSYEAILFEANEMKKLSFISNKPFGSITTEKINQIIQNYKLMGYIKSDVNLDGYIYDPYHKLLNTEEKEYLGKKRKIKYCTTDSMMPYEDIKDTKHIGLTRDIIDELSDILNISFELQKKKEECELASLVLNSQEQNTTKPYYYTDVALISKSSQAYTDDISSLEDKRISYLKGLSIINELQKKYPKIYFVEVESSDEGIKKVIQDEYYGHLDILLTSAPLIQSSYYKVVSIIHKFDEKQPLMMGSDDMIILSAINKALSTFDDKKIENFLSRYSTVNIQERRDNTIILNIAILFGFIATVLIFLIFYFRYKVKKESEKIMHYKTSILEHKKISSLGSMAGLIAHQWRQPLNELSMSQTIILGKIKNDEFSIDHLYIKLDHQNEVLDFLDKTVDNFITFFKNDEAVEKVDVQKALEKASAIFKETLTNDNIVLKVETKGDTFAYISQNLMMQVFLSLIQNSYSFLVSRMVLNPWISITIEESDDGLIITFEDNAGGIRMTPIEDVFLSSSSKKDDDVASSGMGLYMVKMIVEDKFDGKIEVSNSKNGAMFVISLKK